MDKKGLCIARVKEGGYIAAIYTSGLITTTDMSMAIRFIDKISIENIAYKHGVKLEIREV